MTADWIILNCTRTVQLMSLGTGLVGGAAPLTTATGGPQVAQEAKLRITAASAEGQDVG